MGTRTRKEQAPERKPDVAMPTLAAEPVPVIEGTQYESIRISSDVHKLRFAVSSRLVNAGEGQTITYREKPFPQFKVLPSGVEIPLGNVTSAIPKDAALVRKLTHKSRIQARQEALAKVLEHKEIETPGGVVMQDVEDDGYIDESTDGEDADGIEADV